MRKKLLFSLGIFLGLFSNINCFADDFDFNNFAIIPETGDVDITAEDVYLNSGADVVSVGGFDIAGIMLGMSFDDVYELFFKSKGLYTPRKKNSIIYTINNEWKYNLDYECRQQGTFVPAELEKCINTLAQNRGLLYASEIHLERENTGETIVVYLTSNATDNRVWRVLYNNDVNDIEGANEKFQRQWENKVLFFWQNVLDKYGAPNSGNDKWISSTNSYDPMMTAYYGALDLQDKGRFATDKTENYQHSRSSFKVKPYAF
ncbi:MAG: hypothetical protein IJN91_05010 [Alphaproteobacteria bacterium]|nr:hypothetical protein [Alphaproteobacteria bacterium]